jgi:hypothetical protein
MDRHIPIHALPEEIQKVWDYIVLLQHGFRSVSPPEPYLSQLGALLAVR